MSVQVVYIYIYVSTFLRCILIYYIAYLMFEVLKMTSQSLFILPMASNPGPYPTLISDRLYMYCLFPIYWGYYGIQFIFIGFVILSSFGGCFILFLEIMLSLMFTHRLGDEFRSLPIGESTT